MMGRDHALSGMLIGMVASTVADLAGAEIDGVQAAILIAVTTGAALWPDLDHPSATAARSFGPVSRALAAMLDRLGVLLHAATATRRDEPIENGHRTITHTLVFALFSGAVVSLVCRAWSTWGTLTVLFVMISLAIRGLLGQLRRRADWVTVTGAAAALTGAAWFATNGVLNAWLIGGCVALGSFTHCLGDSCTKHGCPWLWPVPIRGRRWYRIGTPRWMRFRTGTEEIDGEDWLRYAMWLGVIALLVAQLPGGWPMLVQRAGEAWEWATR